MRGGWLQTAPLRTDGMTGMYTGHRDAWQRQCATSAAEADDGAAALPSGWRHTQPWCLAGSHGTNGGRKRTRPQPHVHLACQLDLKRHHIHLRAGMLTVTFTIPLRLQAAAYKLGPL